jgi:hypothetical protein
MSPRSWITRLFARSPRRPAAGSPLRLESLEDRLSPAVLTVNSTLDTSSRSDPYLSLREAIAIVNSPNLPTDLSAEIQGQISGTLHDGQADFIVFDPDAVRGPIWLSSGQLELSQASSIASITIDGAAAGVTVASGNNSRVLQVDAGVQATLDHLTIADGRSNFSGGGIFNAGTLVVAESTVVGNQVMVVSAQAFGGGGGIYNTGVLTLADSTVSNNFANVISIFSDHSYGDGGGIYSPGYLEIIDSTISDNSVAATDRGAIGIASSGGLDLRNSIVAGNGSRGELDITASNASGSYNLIGVADAGLVGLSNGVDHNQIGTAASPIDPGLLPLRDYGGPTFSMALMPGSPALDAGDPDSAGTLDQRGVPRTGGVNIGAFQASAVILIVQAPDSVTAGDSFDVTVTACDPYGLTDFGYTGTVNLSISDPQVGLIGTYAYTLGDAGSYTFSGISTTAGPQTLSADDGTLNGTADLSVVPGAAAFLVFVPPDHVQVGVPFYLGVAAYDTFGNLATGYTGTVQVTRSDGGDPLVYTFTTADAGQQYFSVTVSQPGVVSIFVSDRDNPNLQGDRIDLSF